MAASRGEYVLPNLWPKGISSVIINKSTQETRQTQGDFRTENQLKRKGKTQTTQKKTQKRKERHKQKNANDKCAPNLKWTKVCEHGGTNQNSKHESCSARKEVAAHKL